MGPSGWTRRRPVLPWREETHARLRGENDIRGAREGGPQGPYIGPVPRHTVDIQHGRHTKAPRRIGLWKGLPTWGAHSYVGTARKLFWGVSATGTLRPPPMHSPVALGTTTVTMCMGGLGKGAGFLTLAVPESLPRAVLRDQHTALIFQHFVRPRGRRIVSDSVYWRPSPRALPVPHPVARPGVGGRFRVGGHGVVRRGAGDGRGGVDRGRR